MSHKYTDEERKILKRAGQIRGAKVKAKYGRKHFVKMANTRWLKRLPKPKVV